MNVDRDRQLNLRQHMHGAPSSSAEERLRETMQSCWRAEASTEPVRLKTRSSGRAPTNLNLKGLKMKSSKEMSRPKTTLWTKIAAAIVLGCCGTGVAIATGAVDAVFGLIEFGETDSPERSFVPGHIGATKAPNANLSVETLDGTMEVANGIVFKEDTAELGETDSTDGMTVSGQIGVTEAPDADQPVEALDGTMEVANGIVLDEETDE